MLRQADQAISGSNRALEIDPGYPWALRWLGEGWLLKERYEEAADAFSKIGIPVIGAGFLGYCHARSGSKPKARQLLQNLERTSSLAPALQIAVLHLALGDKNAAVNWLHKACEARSMGVHWLGVEPIWDALRCNPRFTDVLRKMRLAECEGGCESLLLNGGCLVGKAGEGD
jgi:hypothetical protein